MPAAEKNILKIRDLCLGYNNSPDLVGSLNAELREGEMIALVGRNGTGKSTLLRTIARIQSFSKGTILLNGKELKAYTTAELASLIAFVGTGRSSFENMSVFEMVSLGRHPYTNWWGSLKDTDREKVLESIRFVGMGDYIDVKVDRLSDGERQRVMIASALAQDTKIIILDEPTAFLDIPNRIEIAEVLYKLKKSGKSVIFSTHDFDSAFNYADKMWVIHDRFLIEGAPEDLGIRRIFEKIFKDSELIFDNVNLRFKRQLHAAESIYIDGSKSEAYQWTCRALERIGYQIEAVKGKSDIEISLSGNASELKWILSQNSNTFEFHSLYDIADYLTKIR